MRPRYLLAAAVLFVAGCTDNPGLTEAGSDAAARQIVAPVGTLEQNIYTLFQLFPKGLSTAGLNRWTTVKRAYQAGLANPAKMPQAYDQVFRLAEWVQDMAPRMSDPPGDETRTAAAARLTLYMSLYVYNGPTTTPPAYSAGADNAVGLVTPSQGATIVTPSTNAGVSIEAGAVDVNTIVVITENPTPYPANCSGPLPTTRCQYPRFYHFSQFPHARLNIAAKFAVCHVNDGALRLPLADHERFRLAHNKPTNPADYTPGSTIVDGIEILPFVTQTFSLCDEIEYALGTPSGLKGIFARATKAIEELVTPKSAFAIDQGGGGLSYMFSDFNNVDPDGAPDDTVTAFSAPDTVLAGSTITMAYTVTNVGTATSPVVPADFSIQPVYYAAVLPSIPLTSTNIMSLVPGQSTIAQTTTATIPTAASGYYWLYMTLGSNAAFPDAVLTNNQVVKTIYVQPTGPFLARTTPKRRIGR
ncbi:MAG TPA: CARDB domain-containing protein [Gemmatimonadaceae bacterium]|nr:CARDB domain-containing protein [Gemmatimonadaceae bacterium]